MSVADFLGMLFSALAMQATVLLFGYRFSKGEYAAIESSIARNIFPAFVPGFFFLMFLHLAATDWLTAFESYWELMPIAILTWAFGVFLARFLFDQRTVT